MEILIITGGLKTGKTTIGTALAASVPRFYAAEVNNKNSVIGAWKKAHAEKKDLVLICAGNFTCTGTDVYAWAKLIKLSADPVPVMVHLTRGWY